MTTPRRQITNLADLAGKTIERAVMSDDDTKIFQVFKDNSFFYVHAFDMLEIDADTDIRDLMAVGLATPEEIAEEERLKAEQDQRWEAERKADRRREYEKLKVEFEPGPTS
jgi:hypothetical protein